MTEDPDGAPMDGQQERAESQWDHEVCLALQCQRLTQGDWNRRAQQILGRPFLTWEVQRAGDVNDTIRALRRRGCK